jgi:hypothetical protein
MAGVSSLCIEGRILPLYGAHVAHERFNCRWPLPQVAGSPDRRVLSASLTSVRSSGRPRLGGLSDPTSLRLNPTDLPCSHETLRLHAGGTNPGSTPAHSPWRALGFRLPPWETGSAASMSVISGLASRSLAFRPTSSLSTLRSDRYRAPRKTRYTAAGLALRRPPSQATEFHALARRNSHTTGRAVPHPAVHERRWSRRSVSSSDTRPKRSKKDFGKAWFIWLAPLFHHGPR